MNEYLVGSRRRKLRYRFHAANEEVENRGLGGKGKNKKRKIKLMKIKIGKQSRLCKNK